MGEIAVGTWVRLTGFEPDEEEVFRIVPDGQANPLENDIPISSPLADALRGAKAGDRVKFYPPAGEVDLKILEVGQL